MIIKFSNILESTGKLNTSNSIINARENDNASSESVPFELATHVLCPDGTIMATRPIVNAVGSAIRQVCNMIGPETATFFSALPIVYTWRVDTMATTGSGILINPSWTKRLLDQHKDKKGRYGGEAIAYVAYVLTHELFHNVFGHIISEIKNKERCQFHSLCNEAQDYAINYVIEHFVFTTDPNGNKITPFLGFTEEVGGCYNEEYSGMDWVALYEHLFKLYGLDKVQQMEEAQNNNKEKEEPQGRVLSDEWYKGFFDGFAEAENEMRNNGLVESLVHIYKNLKFLHINESMEDDENAQGIIDYDPQMIAQIAKVLADADISDGIKARKIIDISNGIVNNDYAMMEHIVKTAKQRMSDIQSAISDAHDVYPNGIDTPELSEKMRELEDLLEHAKELEDNIDAHMSDADSIRNKAARQSAIEAANKLLKELSEISADCKKISNGLQSAKNAQDAADAAQTAADAAQEAGERANEMAEEAKQKAGESGSAEMQDIANKMEQLANRIQKDAQNAQTAADNAQNSASNAESSAENGDISGMENNANKAKSEKNAAQKCAKDASNALSTMESLAEKMEKLESGETGQSGESETDTNGMGQASKTAQKAADNAQKAADKAQELADDANELAAEAEQNAANSGSSVSQKAAEHARSAANNAQEAADRAQEAADRAQEAADRARDAELSGDDMAANTAVDDAKSAFNDAKRELQSAMHEGINTAKMNAESNNSAADNAEKAQQNADAAQAAADSARSAADNMQNRADAAQAAADASGDESDQEAANKMQQMANRMQQNADKAQEAADKAQEAADKAQEAADRAEDAKENEDMTAENQANMDAQKAAQTSGKMKLAAEMHSGKNGGKAKGGKKGSGHSKSKSKGKSGSDRGGSGKGKLYGDNPVEVARRGADLARASVDRANNAKEDNDLMSVRAERIAMENAIRLSKRAWHTLKALAKKMEETPGLDWDI